MANMSSLVSRSAEPGQQGQAIAGGQLGEARAYGQLLNLPAQFLGMQMGAGGKAGMGFGSLFG